MGLRVTSTGTLEGLPQRLRDRARFAMPATRRFAEWMTAEARRRAPVGEGQFRGALRRSLNHAEPAENVTVLRSALPYAQMIQFGGTIRAGGGPLASRMLTIPINDAARKLLAGLGASQSLRSVAGLALVAARGKLFLMGSPGFEAAQGAAAAKRAKGIKTKRARLRDYLAVFILTSRVQRDPQPYAPRMDEPQTVMAAARALRAHLLGAG